MQLSQVELTRFKAFEHGVIRTAPLTVLIGPNNGGKSTVLQSLALLAQTASANTQGRLKLDGPLVDLGDDVNRLGNDSTGTGGPWAIRLQWAASANREGPEIGFELQAVQTRVQDITTSAWVRQNMPPGRPVQASVASGIQSPDKLKISAAAFRNATARLPAIDLDIPTNTNSPWMWQVMQPVKRHDQIAVIEGEPDAIASEILLTAIPFLSGGIAEQLQAFNYVGADRQIVRSVYPLGAGNTLHPQTAEEVINRLAHSDEILLRVSERLRATFDYGLDKTLRSSQQFSPSQHGPLVGLVGTGDGNRRRLLVNMGAGFAQFAWIALHLELARTRQSLYYPEAALPTPVVGVEEPELHLHPRLQPAMARLLAQFVAEGGQAICTTQNEHFLLAVLELVLDKTLKPEQVAVYYLDAPHGAIDRLEVDKKGQLRGGLRGFFEENERQVERQIELLRKSAGLDS